VTLPTLEEAGPDADPEKCAAVVNGDNIDKMTQLDWDRALSCGEHVFARTQPEQKKQLVNRLKERGQIVAMTGDGVNDSPALKAANVGVAVGSGTAVAKEAAQIIIQDDDFNSIVVGVREGRQIFDNLKKAVTYVVTHLFPETLPYVFNFAIGIPLAMETIVIILIDLGTDMLPGISLAYEESEDRIMQIPPRTADEHMVQPKMFMQGYFWTGAQISFFAYWSFYYVFYQYGISFNDTVGADNEYRLKINDMSDSYVTFYRKLCNKNTHWLSGAPGRECSTNAGFDAWMDHFSSIVSQAQAAYFLCFNVMQFANLLNRRNQTQSIFSTAQKINFVMIGAICCSTSFMVIVSYVPTLNNAFFLDQASSEAVCSGFWGVVVIIGLEEFRKAIIRRYPTGFVARWTIY
jgi:sodium/potassium-transporting ATPase subunit alpha